MRTKLLTILLCALLNILLQAQAPAWQWAKSEGNTNDEFNCGIRADASGNFYIAGSDTDPYLTFGTTTLTNVNNGGATSIYVVKYDGAGNVLWARGAGGGNLNFSYIFDFCTDASGNVLITGQFNKSIVFGTYTLTNTDNTGGTVDAFVVKYSSSGNVVWAKSFGVNNSDDRSISISTDPNGNVAIAGYFYAKSLSIGNSTLVNSDNSGISTDVFVARLDVAGNFIWATSIGGSAVDVAYATSCDGNGNVFVTGIFQSQQMNCGTVNLINSDNSGNTWDIFIAKYNFVGNLLWANGIGNSSDETAYSLANDASGNVIMTGSFGSSGLVVGTTTLTHPANTYNNPNTFLAKYDPSGNAVWAKATTGFSGNVGRSISVSSNGDIYLAGLFFGPSIYFGVDSLTNPNTSSLDPNKTELYVAKYDASGNVLWLKNVQGDFGDASITQNAVGTVFVAGLYKSATCLFDNAQLTNSNSSGFSYDICLARFVNGPLGIKEQTDEAAISLYPNPSSSQVTLQTGIGLKNASITITNTFGQTVKSIKSFELRAEESFIISREDLPAGLYILRLMQGGRLLGAEKLVIRD